MSWGKKKIAGQVYDLSHLDAFDVKVTPKAAGAPTYKVRVTFGCHTFTRDRLPADKPDIHFVDGNHRRSFCMMRYPLSLHLPEIIKSSVDGKVYFSDQGNYLLARNIPDCADPYAIYFDMIRAERKGLHAVMDVVSAYPKPDAAKDFPPITFATLVGNTAQKKPIIRPKK